MRHELEKPTFERRDRRGRFVEVRNAGPWETVICGTMKPGAVIGNHYHKKTVVFFYLVRGETAVTVVNVKTKRRSRFRLPAGRGVTLQPNESHAIRFRRRSDFLLLKSRRFDPADPDTYEFPVSE